MAKAKKPAKDNDDRGATAQESPAHFQPESATSGVSLSFGPGKPNIIQIVNWSSD